MRATHQRFNSDAIASASVSFPDRLDGRLTRPAPLPFRKSAARSRGRKIIVPLDGTTFGEHALPLAMSIARGCDAQLHLLHVYPPLKGAQSEALFVDAALHAATKHERKEYLANLVRRLSGAAKLPVTAAFVERDDVAQTVCALSNASADLVVMAARRRSPLRRLFGSPSVRKVLQRDLKVPLLVTAGAEEPPDFTHSVVHRRILVVLDGSVAAEQAIQPAAALATLSNAELTLLRVVPYKLGSGLWDAEDDDSLRSIQSEKANAEKYLKRVASAMEEEGVEVRRRALLTQRSAASAILDYASCYSFDLIALTVRSRRGLDRMRGPSLAENIVRRARQPVLAVPTTDDEDIYG